MKNSTHTFNPGSRIIVPFAAVPLSGTDINTFELQTAEEIVNKLSQIGVSKVFIDIEAPWNQPEEIQKQVEDMRKRIEVLRQSDIEVGLWFWSAVYPKSGTKYMRQVLSDGTQINKCCPLDESYVSSFADYMAALAGTGASALMIDDDFRYGFERKDIGCFCPLHLQAISNVVGHPVTLEEARQAILTGGENPIRSAFLQVNGNSLVSFAQRMRTAVDRVNPSVRIAVCSCLSSWEMDGTTPEAVSRAFAGKTKPWLRTSGAPYWADHRSFKCRMEDIFEFERMQTALFAKPDLDVMWEGDAYPRPRWNCSATSMEYFDIVRAISDRSLLNLKYLFEYWTELKNEEGYLRRHLKNIPLYRAIAEHFDDKTPCGIRVFEVPLKFQKMDIPKRLENNVNEIQLTVFNPSAKILSPVGLPTVWEGEGVGIAVFGENAKYLPESDFGKGLILDARAAEILTQRGVDVGMEEIGQPLPVAPGIAMEHYIEDDLHIELFGQPIRDLTLNPNVIPETTVPSPNGDKQLISSYRYENANGQRFFVFCSDAYGSDERYHRVYSRSHLLARSAEWVSGKKLPAWTFGSPDLYIICKENKESMSVGVLNLFEDETFDTTVMLGQKYSRIEFISGNGELIGDRVSLHEIPPFGFVGFELYR